MNAEALQLAYLVINGPAPDLIIKIASTLLVHELYPRLKRLGIPIENSPISPFQVRVAAYCKHLKVWDTREIRRRFDEAFERMVISKNPYPSDS